MFEENITFRSLYRKISSLQENINNVQCQTNKLQEDVLNTTKNTLNESRNLLNESIKNHTSYINSITSQLNLEKNRLENSLTLCTQELKESTLKTAQELKKSVSEFTQELKEKINTQDKEHTLRDTQLYNTINALDTKYNNIIGNLDKKYSKMHFDIIHNDNNVAITYVNSDGQVEYGSIEKIVADEESLTKNKGKISLKYKFDNQDFIIDSEGLIKNRGLSLINGEKLSADKLNNDLSNATYNISNLNYKVENILKKLETVNGYVASNNFKKSIPDQESLTNFVIELISGKGKKLNPQDIPNGIKIKNLYDNHIWILNRIISDGLTTIKWEDFGSDSICFANNEGVHGLVTGSNDKLKGYIDINGVISINGLAEELQNILEYATNLKVQFNNIELKQLELEKRIQTLEDK